MRVVDKQTALDLLAEHKRALLHGEPGCVMCALARGGAGLPYIAQSEHAVVVLDRFACRHGHLLVIPRRHVDRATALPLEVFLEVQRLSFEASRCLEGKLSPARVFTASLGAAVELPMTYSHFHLHVIPVFETDERARPARVLSWSEGVVVYEDAEALELSLALADAWTRLDDEQG